VKDPRGFFERNLELIDSVSAAVCRRFGCRGADAEDFASLVRLRLLEDDCSRLRRFQGRSGVKTYLVFVATNLFRDERNRLWGKWRASATAKRLGVEAVLLERLTTRDGRNIDEAVEILVKNFKVTMSRQELWTLWHQLPEKAQRKLISSEGLLDFAVDGDETARLEAAEKARAGREAAVALREAFGALNHEDQLLLRLCFGKALTVARISRALGESQRRLYYRREVALGQLRGEMEERGISAEVALSTLGWDGWNEEDEGATGVRKLLCETVYRCDTVEMTSEEDDLDRRDPSGPRDPGRLRRRRPPGGGEEASRRAPGDL
jgi:RNA polymerase sigma factor (sigma-70 family)